MASSGVPVEIEEDDELFEIDLEAVNSIISPRHFCEDTYGFFTATGGAALLANCLLPISDLSNAVPMADSADFEMFPFATPPEPTRLEKAFQLPLGFGLRQALINRSEMKLSSGWLIC